MQENRRGWIDSYTRGWKKINELCGFETVILTETKVYKFEEHEFIGHPGMGVLDVPDNVLAKWLYLCRKVSEAGISGEELIRAVTGVEDGEEN